MCVSLFNIDMDLKKYYLKSQSRLNSGLISYIQTLSMNYTQMIYNDDLSYNMLLYVVDHKCVNNE